MPLVTLRHVMKLSVLVRSRAWFADIVYDEPRNMEPGMRVTSRARLGGNAAQLAGPGACLGISRVLAAADVMINTPGH